MARPIRPSNVVLIQGPARLWNWTHADVLGRMNASETMKPGHKVELFDDSGVLNWRLQLNLTLPHQMAFVAHDTTSNVDIDTEEFLAGEFVPIYWAGTGAVLNVVLTAGESVVAGTTFVNSTGGVGTFAAQGTPTAAANNALFLSLDTKTTVAVGTRCRIVRIQ